MTVTPITLADLTTATPEGNGVFDTLMRANKAHLDAQFKEGRFKGPEYATVYLGSMQAVMTAALTFLLQKEASNLDLQLKEKQIELAEAQLAQAAVQVQILEQQRLNLVAEGQNLAAQKTHTEAQAALVAQQKINLEAEALNIPKQGLLLDANKAQVTQQTTNLASQNLQIQAETALTGVKQANATIEGTVLTAQECLLRAQYDVTMLTKGKTTAETDLLEQKIVTEQAQVSAVGVDADSVVGRQKQLYTAQTAGFQRDAEQKAAKILIDTWSVRRTTDDGTSANTTNQLDDTSVGRAVAALLTGISA